MKRFLLSIIMVVIGLSAFSQSPSRFINLQPAYPVAIGENTVDEVVFSNNGLYLQDIIQDSLPQYEIGQIFAQTVRYTEEGHGFYVKADSLHSLNVVYSYEVNEPPMGTIKFNETTGLFKFYPAADDYKSFTIIFSATNGVESVSEEVEFNLMPQTMSETSAFQTLGVLPSADDYTTVAETSKTVFLNNEERTAYSISISGKDVIFDNNVQNKVWGLSGRDDIYELNIYAERLVIRSALSFPQANITIYAKELVFEDHGGTVASINTSPIPITTLVDGEGLNGGNAGNMHLYIGKITSNMAKRLILNGAKGQCTNRNGTPGNGGNGGVVIATIDLSKYCDFARGSAGVKYDVASDGTTEAGPIISAGEIGAVGRFELEDKPYAYLHPYYISAVMRHANDAFINNRIADVLQTCLEYKALIDNYMNSAEWENAEAEDGMELQNDLTEIDNMLFRLEQGLDYFGNPVGWVPLLSFEVMLNSFDAEIDRAIPTLYMYYWLSRIDQTLQNKVAASQFAASTTEQEIQNNQELINSLILEIPVLQDQVDEVVAMREVLKQRLDELEKRLLSKAKHNVKKRNRKKKALGICKAILNVLPATGPIGTIVSAASNIAFSTGIIGKLVGNDEVDVSSLFTGVGSVDYTQMLGDLQKTLSTVSLDTLGLNPHFAENTYNSITKTIAPITNCISDLSKIWSSSSTPANEVQAELKRLKDNSVEWQDLTKEIENLVNKELGLRTKITEFYKDVANSVSEISNDVLALDALRRDAFTGNSKRDLNAMLYMEKMEQRAKNRLLKYHYYLRKAYEYRLLKPYEGDFNLVGMFERFESLGMALDGVINEAAYASLGSIFRDVVSEMAEKITTEYSTNNPEQSSSITLVISKDQLKAINAKEDITLNFHDMGIFASDEENVRIVNLEIEHLETHVEGNVGASGHMDLNITHSGISTFRKDGNLYWFDHRSRNATSPHTWGIRYDAVTNKTTNIQPSAASTSLIRSLINTDDVMLFSRPSAWSDVALTKKVHSSGGADVVIDSLVIKLDYDFTRRLADIRNIDITANEGLLPYIACSVEDISGRSNGNGHLYRSYTKSSQPVTFTAVDKYESFWFKNWTDRAGNIVSNETALTVDRLTDQFYTANYEYHGPILSVPDTIYVGNDGGSFTVNVRNIGIGDEEMDWYVTDSLSTFVHIDGPTEGIDDGSFTFTFETNPTGERRMDYIEVVAPESYIMSKTICIVQTDEVTYNHVDVTDISKLANAIYINPIKTSKGSKAIANIQLKNAESATAYVFDLVLPDGITVAKNENGRYLDEMSDRHDDHTRNINYKGGNTYSFSALSGNSELLTGNDGTIRIVTLQVDDEIAENAYEIDIKKASYSKSDGTLVSLPNTKTSILVVNYMIGDVNGNGSVDIGDAVTIVNYLVGKESSNFVEKAADTNNNGQIDIGDAVTIVNYLVGKTESLSRQANVDMDEKEPQ